ncbi:MAG: signal peptidase II [Dehalococcoidia bacterium]|nr:signal peptidase II [Dehalococcoidia bacterium]
MDHSTETAPRERATDRLIHRLGRFLAVAGAVVLVDQVTKSLIRGWLSPGERWPEGWDLIHLSHVRNSGAAFGILQGASEFLIVAALVGIGAITFFLLTLPAHHRWYPLALSAVLGGAIGNLTDRVRLGYVTDFIDPMNYPAFNIADSAIVLGVIAIAVLSFVDGDVPGDGDEGPERAEGVEEADASADASEAEPRHEEAVP